MQGILRIKIEPSKLTEILLKASTRFNQLNLKYFYKILTKFKSKAQRVTNTSQLSKIV